MMEKVREKTPEQTPVVIDLTSKPKPALKVKRPRKVKTDSGTKTKKGVWRCTVGCCGRICKEGEPAYVAGDSPETQKFCGYHHSMWNVLFKSRKYRHIETYFKWCEQTGRARWDENGGET